MQVPRESRDTVAPATEQVVGVVDEKVTVRPDVADADTLTLLTVISRSAKGLKVMV